MSTYLWVVWKRLPVILLTIAVTLAVAFAARVRSPTQYTAEVEILVTPYGIDRPDNASRIYLEQVTNTFSAILNSETVQVEAQRRLGVERLPAFELSAVPNSELLALTVRDKSPGLVGESANTLADLLIDTVESRYNTNARNIAQTIMRQLQQREEEIQTLARARAQTVRSSGGNGQLAELNALISANRNAYDDLLQRHNQALVAVATQANLASVFEVATPSVQPSSRSLPLVLTAGAFVGLFAGLALAFINEKARPRFYYPAQVKASLATTILGNIPRGHQRRELRVYTGGRNERQLTDAFRRLQAAVLAHLHSRKNAVLLATSPQPKDGTSFVADNFADALARSRSKTLLIDANFGSPTAHRVFDVANEVGLSNILVNQVPPTQAIQETNSGLNVLTTGSQRVAAADLLGSRGMEHLLSELKPHYDYIIIDSAPVLAVADAPTLSRFVDAVLMVIRRDASETAVVQAAAELAGRDVGVVLNGYDTPAKAAWTRRYTR